MQFDCICSPTKESIPGLLLFQHWDSGHKVTHLTVCLNDQCKLTLSHFHGHIPGLKGQGTVQILSMGFCHGAAMDCVFHGWYIALWASMVKTHIKFIDGLCRFMKAIDEIVPILESK